MYKEYQSHKLTPTPTDIEGPFYKADAPDRTKLTDQPNLTLTGLVKNVDGDVLAGALLDFWQADAKGVYDNEGFTFRGKQSADANGRYRLETIRPGDYQIDENEFRCSHIHVKVSAPGHKLLTTQLYFAHDQYNSTDHWFDARRIVREPEGVFDFVLEKAT